jgi:hypothetical protein
VKLQAGQQLRVSKFPPEQRRAFPLVKNKLQNNFYRILALKNTLSSLIQLQASVEGGFLSFPVDDTKIETKIQFIFNLSN